MPSVAESAIPLTNSKKSSPGFTARSIPVASKPKLPSCGFGAFLRALGDPGNEDRAAARAAFDQEATG